MVPVSRLMIAFEPSSQRLSKFFFDDQALGLPVCLTNESFTDPLYCKGPRAVVFIIVCLERVGWK